MKKHDKSALMSFCKYFRRFHMLNVKACSETALFIEWSNQGFYSLQFGKYMSYEDLFFSEILKFDVDSKNHTKNEKNVFVFQIIAF